MNVECSVALNVLSIVYTVILFVNLKYKQKQETLNYLYSIILAMICVFLALDTVYAVLYGSSAPMYKAFLKFIKSLYFLVNAIIVRLWANYVDYTIYGDACRHKKHTYVYTAILAVNTLLVVSGLFTGLLFQITPEGTFMPGPAMWWFTGLNYLSILMAAIVVVTNRRRMKKTVFLTLLLFPLPPLCAEIVQIFFRPFSLICTYAVSALMVFQISQNNTLYTDFLTGLANRRKLDETLDKWFSSPKGHTVCGIMLDLDGLKRINDSYGHLRGDHALMSTADVIRSIRHRDILSARYGGDEFLLLWLSKDGLDLPEVEQKLEAGKQKVNASLTEQDRIDFSVGTFCCPDNGTVSKQDFLKNLDESMYRAKKQKKQRT